MATAIGLRRNRSGAAATTVADVGRAHEPGVRVGVGVALGAEALRSALDDAVGDGRQLLVALDRVGHYDVSDPRGHEAGLTPMTASPG